MSFSQPALRRSFCILLSLILSLCGCAQRTPVLVAASESSADNSITFEQLRPGDTVEIRLKSGEKDKYLVAAVLAEALQVDIRSGRPQRYQQSSPQDGLIEIPFADIASIDLIDTSRRNVIVGTLAGGTVVLIAAVVVVGGAIATILANIIGGWR